MPQGMIVKALSGYYYVLPDGDGQDRVQCRARGIFKKKNVSPLVGDRVIYEVTENGEGTVDEIMPRSTELIRPPVANVELAVLVFSVAEPVISLPLLDKFLIHTESVGLETVIVFTKHDLLAEDTGGSSAQTDFRRIRHIYESIGYPIVTTSAMAGDGLESIRAHLQGRISVFAGQSGVGKSSLLNALVPELNLQTSEISHRLGRGRHTTRHVELIALEPAGWVADTPGFSQLDFMNVEAEQLADSFREFRTYSPGCRFRGCLHQHEPGCKVREAVEAKEIAATRYDHYLLFLTEIRDKKRRY
ncbi:ribosome small subunit-dependent GTPase A [Paenibacillus sp. J2TS4]|uniref:ribosome small subunit-dependent GTPase A n=1 Tax=Paenibacillus sp. J2TS4 TaxID=2807194 RepID=UPI001AFE1939|nr:ribosome small subunit-dependent GTPase A [Paenibacillus sp. J2TS4]GIP32957.1 putative ribosome biogenesis GTPase RsgA [Paenibacillus sp. J2TS4]